MRIRLILHVVIYTYLNADLITFWNCQDLILAKIENLFFSNILGNYLEDFAKIFSTVNIKEN